MGKRVQVERKAKQTARQHQVAEKERLRQESDSTNELFEKRAASNLGEADNRTPRERAKEEQAAKAAAEAAKAAEAAEAAKAAEAAEAAEAAAISSSRVLNSAGDQAVHAHV